MKKLLEFIKTHYAEIIRFVIVGVIATLSDYLLSLLFMKVIYTDPTPIFGGHSLSRSELLARTIGYTFGIIVNYLLSTFFVFKNVEDKKVVRSVKGFIIFTLLSLGGLLINLGVTNLGKLIYSLEYTWWYTIVFIFATGVVMFYNYITRKFILYRESKSDDTLNEETQKGDLDG